VSWPRGRALDGGVDEIPVPHVAGRLWLCGKHAVGPDPEGALARVGATTLVCLNERDELEARYPAYVEWLIAEDGQRAIWYPIPDLHAPTLDDARMLLDDLAARLARGDRLLVHCGAGVGRAGTIAACVLVVMGDDVDTALQRVAHRPMAGPEVGAQRELLDAVAAPRVKRQ
jgi:protein-tyrosine phosphatase